MDKLQIRWMLFVMALKEFPHYLKCLVWNRGLRLLWCKLWIRKDEFHSSLEMDLDAMWYMSPKKVQKYLEDLMNRRRIAHERDTCQGNDLGKTSNERLKGVFSGTQKNCD